MKKFSDGQITDEFVNDRIKQNKTDFYDTIQKNKLETFSLTETSEEVLCKRQKEVIIQPDRSLFARLLVIREKTGISIRVQLRHSLGPVAWSLATPEGCIYKSVESKLLNAIEERIKTVDEIPSKSAIIYDGIIHQLPKYLETFRDLS